METYSKKAKGSRFMIGKDGKGYMNAADEKAGWSISIAWHSQGKFLVTFDTWDAETEKGSSRRWIEHNFAHALRSVSHMATKADVADFGRLSSEQAMFLDVCGTLCREYAHLVDLEDGYDE